MGAIFMKWAPYLHLCPSMESPLSVKHRQSKATITSLQRPTVKTLTLAKMNTETKKKKNQKPLAKRTSTKLSHGDLAKTEVSTGGGGGGEDAAANDDDYNDEEMYESRRTEFEEKVSQLLSNAQRLKMGSTYYSPRYSLGIDFGDARSGVAISKGFAPRPIEVVELRGQKLDERLIEIAEREGAVEFVVGLPKSSTGLSTHQSRKTRCFAGRLAVLAARRGWCVYLHDEFGSSEDALDYMLMTGSTRKDRKMQLDAYAAVVLLQSYFDNSGMHTELLLPKKLSLQARICEGPTLPESDDDVDYEEG